ncbi:hypothetical protein LQZ21_10100 [Treponema sp. TIM-1]|uniref:hypothetical protein n=1 Tax=Treponema sp. TIM-1 TaxID=2898417 RepID=UPI00397EBC65
MAKKNAIYAPGELDRVREKLGDVDAQEAKRLAQLLGGEVGVERSETPKPIKRNPPPVRRQVVEPGRRSYEVQPRLERVTAPPVSPPSPRKKAKTGADDPSVPIRLSYWERVKMDRYAGNPEFGIKSFFQVVHSVMSIFGSIPDRVSPSFVNRKMNDYYKRIETLVTATRTLIPRNDKKRSEQLKKTSFFAFTVLNTIRYWNIERIASDLAKIQAHPRKAVAAEFIDILRAIYKPLFVLEQLDMERHIKEAYKLLYKILYLEDPVEAKEKYQELIRISLNTLLMVRREIRFLLYPLLLKLLSDRFLPYEQFFIERKNRFMAFIDAREEETISPALAERDLHPEIAPKEEEGEAPESEEPESEEKKEKQAAAESEHKAVERGLHTLEMLFPKAGWERIASFPDFYPYFSDIFNLKRNYDLIAPTDPLQQVAILTRILSELFFGLRSVKFGVVLGSEGITERIDEALGNTLNNWNIYAELSFDKEYLPRLVEYCHVLDSAVESRNSNYTKRLLNELHWIKRLYFLPYYKFESFYAPPFKKGDIGALYPEIRRLRKYLTAVAAGIEQGNKQGGAEKMVACDGIDNPWEPYVFQVANPVSTRLDALLKNPKQRNNAALVFFTLAVTTVLDYIINNESSWAYENKPGPLFRSLGGEGTSPLYGVENKVDTNALFKASLKEREQAKDADK